MLAPEFARRGMAPRARPSTSLCTAQRSRCACVSVPQWVALFLVQAWIGQHQHPNSYELLGFPVNTATLPYIWMQPKHSALAFVGSTVGHSKHLNDALGAFREHE